MELNVEDYVRTDKGLIGKVIKKEEYDTHIILEYEGQYCKRVLSTSGNDSEIIKSSPNIIGLIEVGDYVNNYYVEDITNTGEELVLHIITGSNHFQSPFLYNEDIKSVLTHEQFEAMKYKVGEK